MKRCVPVMILGLIGVAVSGGGAGAQPAPDWPDWAYGLLTTFAPGDRVAPPCPPTAQPIECAYIGEPVPDDGIKRTLPDTTASFTRNEAYFGYGPADWYPGDHPPMPEVVARGKPAEGLRACALCHYPNGQGKMENGHVSGLPAAYILEQLEAFASGARRSADPRKANTNEMAMIAAGLTDVEKRQIAEYFSSMEFLPLVRVVEAEEVPQVRTTTNGLMLPIPDAPPMLLGQRIIEVPEFPERTEFMRDPRAGFIAYVPVGSLAKGEALVTTGGGKTIPCGLCHGPEQRGSDEMPGIGVVPGIAGRTASYIMRQLWDIQQGTRLSPLMAPVVANLTAEDMLNITAYVTSLTP